jgi:hypothetical protein
MEAAIDFMSGVAGKFTADTHFCPLNSMEAISRFLSTVFDWIFIDIFYKN